MQEQTARTTGPIKGKGPDGEEKIRPFDKVFIKWLKQPPGEKRDFTGKVEQVHPHLANTLETGGYVEIIDEDEAKEAANKAKAEKGTKSKAAAANASLTRGKDKKSDPETEI